MNRSINESGLSNKRRACEVTSEKLKVLATSLPNIHNFILEKTFCQWIENEYYITKVKVLKPEDLSNIMEMA